MAEIGIIVIAEQAAEILSPFLKEGGEKVIEFFTNHPEIAKGITEFPGNARKLVTLISKKTVEHYQEIGISATAFKILHRFYTNHKRDKKIKASQKDANSAQETSKKNQNALVSSNNSFINKIGKVEETIEPFAKLAEANKKSIVKINTKIKDNQKEFKDLENIFIKMFSSKNTDFHENLSDFLAFGKKMFPVVMTNKGKIDVLERRIDILERRPVRPVPPGPTVINIIQFQELQQEVEELEEKNEELEGKNEELTQEVSKINKKITKVNKKIIKDNKKRSQENDNMLRFATGVVLTGATVAAPQAALVLKGFNLIGSGMLQTYGWATGNTRMQYNAKEVRKASFWFYYLWK